MDFYDKKKWQIAAQKTGVAPATAANFDHLILIMDQIRYSTKFDKFSLKNLLDMDLYD